MTVKRISGLKRALLGGALKHSLILGVAGSSVIVPLPTFKSAVTQAKAGARRGKIHVVGDSTTAGDWGGTTSNAWANNARAGSWPSQLAALFVSQMGLPFAGRNIFGSAGDAGITDRPSLQAYDAELYVGTDWAPTVGNPASKSLGGPMVKAATSTSTSYGFVDTVLDTADIYYPTNPTLDSAIRVKVGGNVVATINQQLPAGVAKSTVSGSPGSVAIDQGGAATQAAYICGIDAYTAANKGIAVLNSGWGGSSTADWTDVASSAFTAFAMLAIVPADLTIICLGINDWQQGIPLATYQANLTALYNQAKIMGGDVMFVGPNRIDPATTPQATQESYVAAMKQVAANVGARFFDIASIPNFDTYAHANAAGYMGNGLHPKAAGYGQIAAGIYANINA